MAILIWQLEELRGALSRYLTKIEGTCVPIPPKVELPEYVAKVRGIPYQLFWNKVASWLFTSSAAFPCLAQLQVDRDDGSSQPAYW